MTLEEILALAFERFHRGDKPGAVADVKALIGSGQGLLAEARAELARLEAVVSVRREGCYISNVLLGILRETLG